MRAWYHIVAHFTTHTLTKTAYDKIKNVMNMKKTRCCSKLFLIMPSHLTLKYEEVSCPKLSRKNSWSEYLIYFVHQSNSRTRKDHRCVKGWFPTSKARSGSGQMWELPANKQLCISGRWEGRSSGMEISQCGGRKTWQRRISLKGWEQWLALTLPWRCICPNPGQLSPTAELWGPRPGRQYFRVFR